MVKVAAAPQVVAHVDQEKVGLEVETVALPVAQVDALVHMVVELVAEQEMLIATRVEMVHKEPSVLFGPEALADSLQLV